jgi:hypothetical protein
MRDGSGLAVSDELVAGSSPICCGSSHPARPKLALYGLPPAVAEPVQLVAEILGWQVLAPAPALSLAGAPAPDARLCLALLPAGEGDALAAHPHAPPPLLVWSPDNILNELICREGLSVMDQPPCITRVDQLLQTANRSLDRMS